MFRSNEGWGRVDAASSIIMWELERNISPKFGIYCFSFMSAVSYQTILCAHNVTRSACLTEWECITNSAVMTAAQKLLDPFVNVAWRLIVLKNGHSAATLWQFKDTVSPQTHSIDSSGLNPPVCPTMSFQGSNRTQGSTLLTTNNVSYL